MKQKPFLLATILISAVCLFSQCAKDDKATTTGEAVRLAFGNNIDLQNPANYAQQIIPTYIRKDNTGANPINDKKATLGRVLFYDKLMSIDNSISCASCHKQEFAFSDPSITSTGVAGGTTARHGMRLINARFGAENKFFWDERAATLEIQTTSPIKDHAEMGFSAINGRPGISTLLSKLESTGYYKELFSYAYGDGTVTEQRLQECLAQFVRSIQSFDAKYDVGRVQVQNDGQNFPNFTQQENQGKNLWLTPPQFDPGGNRIGGGVGCNACHNAPEFDIDPNSRNNGIIGVINSPNLVDINNTRSPSLRDLLRADGTPNSPMMHTGNFTSFQQVLGHYGIITNNNPNLDPRLRPGGNGQQLRLTAAEVQALTAFMQTLAGTKVYTDSKWKNPFL